MITATILIAVGVIGGAVLALKPAEHRSARSVFGDATSLTRILGVLRRPQTAADRAVKSPPLLFGHLRQRMTLAGTLVAETITPIDSLKRVVPTAQNGPHIGFVPVRISSTTASGTPFTRIALAVIGGGGASCCSTAQQVRSGQSFSSSGGAGEQNTGVLIVPDGVARVRVALPHPLTTGVHENVAVIRTSAGLENLNRYAMTWYSASGKVVKQFTTPRDNRPNPAIEKAQRRFALRTAERTRVHLRPSILASYPIFATDFTATTVGSGPIGFSVSKALLTHEPTFAITEANTVPKYRTDPRNARLIRVGTGLDVWLAAGGQICAFTRSSRDAHCTGTGPAETGLVTVPAAQPDPRVFVALVPDDNRHITADTKTGSHQLATHDGIAVGLAAGVTGLRFTSAHGRVLVHRFGPK